MACPVSVEVTVGNKVDCQVWDGPHPKDVEVKVISDRGEFSVESPR
ncbi:hypothetical protein ACFRU3_34115 [Streptomyces sp. NPDC056910]